MRPNFMANISVFGRKNRDNVPRTLFINLKGENFQNASELNSKQLHFLMQNRDNAPITFL